MTQSSATVDDRSPVAVRYPPRSAILGWILFDWPGDQAVIAPLLLAFGIATVGVEFATVFNNAMMPTLVPPERIGRLSGTGWATGYVGGILSLVLVLGFLAADPDNFRTLLCFK